MTTYEILMLLDPERAEARQDEIVARTRELVEQGGGTWRSHDAWGRRRLAYPIAHKEEGVYHLVVFDSEPATLDEISRVLKIDEAVLRHMATRHVAGSRTSAPRDDAAAPAARPSGPSETGPEERADTVAEEEYADPNASSDEAESVTGEAGDAQPEDSGEE